MNSDYNNTCPIESITPLACQNDAWKWLPEGNIMPPNWPDTVWGTAKIRGYEFDTESEANEFFVNYYLLK